MGIFGSRWLLQRLSWHDFASHMHEVLASDMERIGSHVDVVADMTTCYLATELVAIYRMETVVVCGVDGHATEPMELVKR